MTIQRKRRCPEHKAIICEVERDNDYNCWLHYCPLCDKIVHIDHDGPTFESRLVVFIFAGFALTALAFLLYKLL